MAIDIDFEDERYNQIITLPQGALVSFSWKDQRIDDILDILGRKDFAQEAIGIAQIGGAMPFNLLMYDNVIAYGVNSNNGASMIGLREYSEDLFLHCLDQPLSVFNRPIRVVDKTQDSSIFKDRMRQRTALSWMSYDQSTQVLGEVAGAACAAEKILEFMPASKDLYALSRIGGKTQVLHMRICESEYPGMREQGMRHIMCRGIETVLLEDGLDMALSRYEAEHNDAIVLASPLMYCSEACSTKPYSCLAVKFEQAYARKTYGSDKDCFEQILPGSRLRC